MGKRKNEEMGKSKNEKMRRWKNEEMGKRRKGNEGGFISFIIKIFTYRRKAPLM